MVKFMAALYPLAQGSIIKGRIIFPIKNRWGPCCGLVIMSKDFLRFPVKHCIYPPHLKLSF